jgi:endonuclease/exonuclease/phosphatase family metal-dependent hydrolase
MQLIRLSALFVLCLSSLVLGERITLVSYNIENFRENFTGHRLAQRATTQPAWPAEFMELIERKRREDNRANWIVSEVIRHPQVNADVLVIQESAGQEDLEFFNRRWLEGMYETVIVSPTNTDRDQHLSIMLKPGFKVIEQRHFHETPDVDNVNPDSDRLFARGPSFVLIQSPGGYRFWMGNTHQKSKSGNSIEATRWRNAEAVATRQIIKQLRDDGPADVILMGDVNDAMGFQEFEHDGGGDTVANLVGPEEDGLRLLTLPLVQAGEISFSGYFNPRFRSLIDHAVATTALFERVSEVRIFRDALAPAASDHYPVVVTIDARNDSVITAE